MKTAMFSKILIANRGEIAIRIIRACQELGIQTVAVYSEADKDSLHVKLADEAYCVGPAVPNKSYLCIPAIISAAEVSGADAIHPGYGFLAENADFAAVCDEHNIVFIGPSPKNIILMGDKSKARETVIGADVPVVPGTGVIGSEEDLVEAAAKIGYPVMIKASAGGGGKGMRMVPSEAEVREMYRTAKSEAEAAFGNGDVYLEKMIVEPRHIEFQILSDRHGNAVHLGERDCSIQRRHQKLIEEAPSPILRDTQREAMGQDAIKIARAIRYQGAGTIEFLVDKDLNYYFIEMNTRVQVEHPVTEMVTGVDIIKEQISVAATGTLTIKQDDVQISGHSFEFRVNAEDHNRNFMPCPGKLNLYLPPGGPGVRIDSHMYPGYTIPPTYDSLLAKLIVWGEDREHAIARAKRALAEYVLDGVPTTIAFHEEVLENDQFLAGKFDTSFIDTHFLNPKA